MNNVKEIVKKYLEENGYDGLCCDDCGCSLDNLMPCEGDISNCAPGYKRLCDCGEGCAFHITKTKYDFCYCYCENFEEECNQKCLSMYYNLGNKRLLTCAFFKPKD